MTLSAFDYRADGVFFLSVIRKHTLTDSIPMPFHSATSIPNAPISMSPIRFAVKGHLTG
jgi:hypothetical protein